MDEKYAGNHVAYIDEWTGDEVARTVVAFAPEVAEFHAKLRELPPDVRARLLLTYLSPANVTDAPAVFLE